MLVKSCDIKKEEEEEEELRFRLQKQIKKKKKSVHVRFKCSYLLKVWHEHGSKIRHGH